MFKVCVSLVAILMLGGNYASAQDGSFPDVGQSEEPTVQPDESVADFTKGKGGTPKNKSSVFHNGILGGRTYEKPISHNFYFDGCNGFG